jgi:hypothetical protein
MGAARFIRGDTVARLSVVIAWLYARQGSGSIFPNDWKSRAFSHSRISSS